MIHDSPIFHWKFQVLQMEVISNTFEPLVKAMPQEVEELLNYAERHKVALEKNMPQLSSLAYVNGSLHPKNLRSLLIVSPLALGLV